MGSWFSKELKEAEEILAAAEDERLKSEKKYEDLDHTPTGIDNKKFRFENNKICNE